MQQKIDIGELKRIRRLEEIYVNQQTGQKFIWQSMRTLLRNMIHSEVVDVSARIERASAQYDYYLELIHDVRDEAEQSVKAQMQLNQIRLKIDEMRIKLNDIFGMKQFERGSELYKKI